MGADGVLLGSAADTAVDTKFTHFPATKLSSFVNCTGAGNAPLMCTPGARVYPYLHPLFSRSCAQVTVSLVA
jgi:hypothetical protein